MTRGYNCLTNATAEIENALLSEIQIFVKDRMSVEGWRTTRNIIPNSNSVSLTATIYLLMSGKKASARQELRADDVTPYVEIFNELMAESPALSGTTTPPHKVEAFVGLCIDTFKNITMNQTKIKNSINIGKPAYLVTVSDGLGQIVNSVRVQCPTDVDFVNGLNSYLASLSSQGVIIDTPISSSNVPALSKLEDPMTIVHRILSA